MSDSTRDTGHFRHRHRRRFLAEAAGWLTAAATFPPGASMMSPVAEAASQQPGVRESSAPDATRPEQILDTHQHLWDLQRLRLPWLEGASDVLRRNYTTADYRQAVAGWNVQAIYMEVDVAPEMHRKEAEDVVQLCRSQEAPTVAAVVGGRPADANFADYVQWLAGFPEIKGVRQVLHGATPAGYCLSTEFLRGLRILGEQGLRFDLCLRPTELADAARVAKECPETRFVLDHCGNADVRAFQANAAAGTHSADQWRKDMAAVAARENVICKISGIVARVPAGWTAEWLAPIVNHCWEVFGPERIVFGGDWPVCLLGAPLGQWLTALREIVADRPAAQQRQLWFENARRFYGLA